MESYTKRVQIESIRRVFVLASCFILTACSAVKPTDSLEPTTSDSDVADIDQTNSARYSCDGSILDIYFHADQAQMIWQGKKHLLTQAVSASGAYFLGEDLSFWVHGDDALLSFHDLKKQSCQLVRVDS